MTSLRARTFLASMGLVVGCASDAAIDFDPDVDDLDFATEDDPTKADGPPCTSTPAALARARAAVRSAARHPQATTAQKRALTKAADALTTTGRWLGAFDTEGRSLRITYYWLTDDELTRARSQITAAAALLAPYTRLSSVRAYVNQSAAELPANDLSDATFSLPELRCMPLPSQTNVFTHLDLDATSLSPTAPSLAPLQPAFARILSDEESLWGDTVLEGDVGQTGDASITDIESLTHNGSILGYRLSISAPAVGTYADDCTYDDASEQWTGDGCVPGSITSIRTVNYAGTSIETDDYAEFVED